MRYQLGYFDAYYIKAQKCAASSTKTLPKPLKAVMSLPPQLRQRRLIKSVANLSPAEIYMGDVYTIGVNLAGLPSLSHPVGLMVTICLWAYG